MFLGTPKVINLFLNIPNNNSSCPGWSVFLWILAFRKCWRAIYVMMGNMTTAMRACVDNNSVAKHAKSASISFRGKFARNAWSPIRAHFWNVRGGSGRADSTRIWVALWGMPTNRWPKRMVSRFLMFMVLSHWSSVWAGRIRLKWYDLRTRTLATYIRLICHLSGPDKEIWLAGYVISDEYPLVALLQLELKQQHTTLMTIKHVYSIVGSTNLSFTNYTIYLVLFNIS